MALGPTLGGLLIRFTGQVLPVFYMAGCIHVLYSFLVWFIIPESLTKGHMVLAKARYADSLRVDPDSSLDARFTRIVQRLFSFLMPLAILGPTEKEHRNALNGGKKDWNLTLLAVAYGFTVTMMVSVFRFIFNIHLNYASKASHSYIFQYAAGAFRWSFETVGYLTYIFRHSYYLTAWILVEHRERV